jgi:WD40 repeat protein
MADVTVMWDVQAGEIIHRLKGHDIAVSPNSVAFSPNGQTAFSVSLDGALIEWQIADLSLDQLRGWVSTNRCVRDLTCEERVQYRVEPYCKETMTR